MQCVIFFLEDRSFIDPFPFSGKKQSPGKKSPEPAARWAAQHFFHPDHVVPTVKLKGAVVKYSDCLITHFFVKAHTVKSQVLILNLSRDSDAGVGIEDVLPLQKKFIPCANAHVR